MIPNHSYHDLFIYLLNCARALKAAPMILNLTNADNGASLIVNDPGILPS